MRRSRPRAVPEMPHASFDSLRAHFSDRGRRFRRDRGRRFRAIVDAQGMRASEELNVSQGPERFPASHREARHH